MKRTEVIAVASSLSPRSYLRSTAGGVLRRPNKKSSTITVWLQVDAQSGWPDPRCGSQRSVPKEQHPGVERRRAVPELANTPGPSSTRRSPAGNAPDVIEMGNTEMTKYMAAGAFPGLSAKKSSFDEREHVARGPGAFGPLQREAVRRPVLRGLARRHLPHRPLEQGRPQGAEDPGAVHGRREEAEHQVRQEGLLARLHRRAGLVRRDGLRLRLRRADRHQDQRQVEGRARRRRSRSPASPPSRTSSTPRPKASKTTIETRPEPVRRVLAGSWPRRSSARPGSLCCVGKQYTERDRAVRHAEPHGREGHAGLPRRL